MSITRDLLAEDGLRRMVREANPDYPLISDEELYASHRETLERMADLPELWVFGYGSLIWNPVFDVAETRPARLDGYSRQFCILALVGRGTPEKPGLWLGLNEGGSCEAAALRIDNARREEETLLLWRREMIGGVYRPEIVEAVIDGVPTPCLAFLTNPDSCRYAPALSEAEQARHIAQGEGNIGTCREYLFNLDAKMREHGYADAYIARMTQAVQAIREV